MCIDCCFMDIFYTTVRRYGPDGFEQWKTRLSDELIANQMPVLARYALDGQLVKDETSKEWLLRIESPGTPILVTKSLTTMNTWIEGIDPFIEEVSQEEWDQ